jgi:hypothetical protein
LVLLLVASAFYTIPTFICISKVTQMHYYVNLMDTVVWKRYKFMVKCRVETWVCHFKRKATLTPVRFVETECISNKPIPNTKYSTLEKLVHISGEEMCACVRGNGASITLRHSGQTNIAMNGCCLHQSNTVYA